MSHNFNQIVKALGSMSNADSESERNRFGMAMYIKESSLWRDKSFYSDKSDFTRYGNMSWNMFLKNVFLRTVNWFNKMSSILSCGEEGKAWLFRYGVGNAFVLAKATNEQRDKLLDQYTKREMCSPTAMRYLYSELYESKPKKSKQGKRIKVVEMVAKERAEYEKRIEALEAENAFLKEELKAKSSKLYEVQNFFGKWGNSGDMTMDRVLGMAN